MSQRRCRRAISVLTALAVASGLSHPRHVCALALCTMPPCRSCSSMMPSALCWNPVSFTQRGGQGPHCLLAGQRWCIARLPCSHLRPLHASLRHQLVPSMRPLFRAPLSPYQVLPIICRLSSGSVSSHTQIQCISHRYLLSAHSLKASFREHSLPACVSWAEASVILASPQTFILSFLDSHQPPDQATTSRHSPAPFYISASTYL